MRQETRFPIVHHMREISEKNIKRHEGWSYWKFLEFFLKNIVSAK